MKLTDKAFLNDRYSLIELLDLSLNSSNVINQLDDNNITHQSLCKVVFKSECSVIELRRLAEASQDVMTEKSSEKKGYTGPKGLFSREYVSVTKATYLVHITVNGTVKRVEIDTNKSNSANQFEMDPEEFERASQTLNNHTSGCCTLN